MLQWSSKHIKYFLLGCGWLVGTSAQAAQFDESILRLIEGGDFNQESTVRTPKQAPALPKRPEDFGIPAQTGSLSLIEAEILAIQQDPLIRKFDAKASALSDRAKAATRLPDPKLKFGVANLAARTFNFEQEPMTQAVVGIQQTFSPSSTRTHSGKRLGMLGEQETAQSVNQKLVTVRELRKAWLKIYLQHHADTIISQSLKIFEQLVEITKLQYRSGRGNQQDVIRAQLEKKLLEDQKILIAAKRETAEADLIMWIGQASGERPLQLESLALPDLPDKDIMAVALDRHPLLKADRAALQAAHESIEVARSKYSPSWMVDLSYGYRGEDPIGRDRADFISAMIVVDLPIFQSNLQDRWLEAAEKEYTAKQSSVEDRRRELKRMFDGEYANWKYLDERLKFYQDAVLPEAFRNAQAALKAYQSRVTDFEPLMRARLQELKLKLQALQLLVDRADSQINLLYIAGEGA